jgi:radical SAM superfamily enzyme YgiQ (UPF0313 family)
VVRQRLADETGRIEKDAPNAVALAYPSPYAAGMSSLGFQRIYRSIQEQDGFTCHRAFLADGGDSPGAEVADVLTYEALRPLSSYRVICVSVAYELEIAGLVRMLDAAGIPIDRRARGPEHPFLLLGGPLTFSNPAPLLGYADAIIMGEAKKLIGPALDILYSAGTREAQLEGLAKLPSITVPAIRGSELAAIAAIDDELLPAWGPIRTPHAEFANMFLIETERGCSRGCKYCVMRRSTNGGMRIVPKEKILGLVPKDTPKVGLVGAAVSDHPKIVEIINALADEGKQVGLSSLRPDRMNDDFVAALARGGYRTLTTAMDGTSQRVRASLERKAKEPQLERCAQLVRKHGMDRLKLYLMIGTPGEEDEDVDECVRFTTELSKIAPVSLGIAPFVSKRNTPLDGLPFAGIDVVQDRLERLRRGVKGRVDIRSTSAKWAWVEWVLAQGGEAEGLAVAEAVRAGGTFADYKKAFRALDERGARSPLVRKLPVVAA